MADIKWIKIVTDIFDDEKILLIEAMPDSYAIIVCWFKLLCFAGKQNNNGVLMLNDRIAYTDQMLATVFRMNLNTVKLALSTFESLGMIVIAEDVIQIKNWQKYQSIKDKQTYNEYMKELMRKRRAEQKMLVSNDVSNDVNNVSLQEERNKNKEERNKNKEIDNKCKRFTPPTLDDIKAYCQERHNNVDAQKFYDYYTEGNWHDAKGNSVKNWKQKLLTWERKDNTSAKPNPSKIMDEREYKDEDFSTGYYADIMNRPRMGQ